MPVLDSCVTSNFEPGNIGASIGTEPIVIRPGTIYDPDDYPFDDIEYSLHFQRFYNFAYYGAL
jgi:hypothetical protein